MNGLPSDKVIILFDGVCNLCDNAVQYLIKRDKKDIFRFVPLQSELGIQILDYLKVDRLQVDSMILYEPGKAYFLKSSAALEALKMLGGINRWLTMFSFIPSSLRDPLYDFVARNRYKWYGKKESCLMPTDEIKAKFLEKSVAAT